MNNSNEPTNAERAERIERVIEAYAQILGTPSSPEEDLCDMLTDMMHYSRIKALDLEFYMYWDDIYEMAKMNFDAEVLEEQSTNES